jgi:damage-control phosphatase, subfamily I
MKLQLNCGSCMVKQAIAAMSTHEIENSQQLAVLEKLIEEIPHYLDQPTPSHFQSILLEKLSEYLNIEDVYLNDKEKQNSLALDLLPIANENIVKSAYPLHSAALLAVEGNSIDQLFLKNINMVSAINNLIHKKFMIDHFNSFIVLLERSNSITYIHDNAGEIVFDRLFIEQCQEWRIEHNLPAVNFTSILKGGPVLNDATVEDGYLVGLDKVSRVISSGTNYLGLPQEYLTDETRAAIETADIVISKGQANFETLDEVDALRTRIFFLLKTKCFHVSDHLKVPVGSSVFYFPV